MNNNNTNLDKSPGLQNIVDSASESNNPNNQQDSENSDSKIDYIEQDDEDPYQNKELRRMTVEYIKILGIIDADEDGETININEILKSKQIPENFDYEKYEPENVIKNGNSTVIYEEEEDKIDFDNDVQVFKTTDPEMIKAIFLMKPKIMCFDGKLGLLYISPILGDNGYNLIIKNPANMKGVYKEKIFNLISCAKKNKNTLVIENFGTKVLTKNNHEMIFKKEEECNDIFEAINYLMKLKFVK